VQLSKYVAAFAALTATFVVKTANATPHPLPFTYTYDTLGAGEVEVEQYVDLVPVYTKDPSGRPSYYLASQFQTEFEYGITDRLELGVYATLAPGSTNISTQNEPVLTEGTGVKERLRYRLFDEGVLPIDIGFYGELVENDIEFEIEAKILLEKRFGNLRIDANLWGEREWHWQANVQDWVINPTAGVTYQISPAIHVGAEFWMRGEWTDPPPIDPITGRSVRPFALGPHEFVGPTVLFELGKLWWANGFYLRVDDINRHPVVGDNYGPAWFRTVIGIGL
jgi:hypothetical protein